MFVVLNDADFVGADGDIGDEGNIMYLFMHLMDTIDVSISIHMYK